MLMETRDRVWILSRISHVTLVWGTHASGLQPSVTLQRLFASS